MKRWMQVTLMVVLALCLGLVTLVQAAEITVNDLMYHNDFGPPLGQAKEVNTLTAGTQPGKEWDMQKFELNVTTKTLSMVGGWNWQAGVSNYRTGDLFIDIGLNSLTGLNSRYGNPMLGGTANTPLVNVNSYWGYDFVVDFDRNLNGSLKNTYTVYQISETANVKFNLVSGGPPEAKYANPYTLDVLNSTGLITVSTGNVAFSDAGGLYSADISLAFLTGYMGSDVLDWILRTHITMSCGNDAMVGDLKGSGANVPLPGAMVLLGAGLFRLVIYRRKKAQVV
jgi:hypothetical protein